MNIKPGIKLLYLFQRHTFKTLSLHGADLFFKRNNFTLIAYIGNDNKVAVAHDIFSDHRPYDRFRISIKKIAAYSHPVIQLFL